MMRRPAVRAVTGDALAGGVSGESAAVRAFCPCAKVAPPPRLQGVLSRAHSQRHQICGSSETELLRQGPGWTTPAPNGRTQGRHLPSIPRAERIRDEQSNRSWRTPPVRISGRSRCWLHSLAVPLAGMPRAPCEGMAGPAAGIGARLLAVARGAVTGTARLPRCCAVRRQVWPGAALPAEPFNLGQRAPVRRWRQRAQLGIAEHSRACRVAVLPRRVVGVDLGAADRGEPRHHRGDGGGVHASPMSMRRRATHCGDSS